jgi:excisionase family DNA binding protein
MAWYKTSPPLRKPPESAMPDHGSETTNDHPWNVRQAARFLGVSPQTVYLWVERKQIPHLRVMGRNIRFLRSDLERFRAFFRQEPERLRDILE